MDARALRPSQVDEQQFSVAFNFPVIFARDVLSTGDGALVWAVAQREPERRHPLFVVLDGGLVGASPALQPDLLAYCQRYTDQLELRGEPLVVPGGEAVKNDPRWVSELQAAFARARLDRHAVVLVVGGGAVLDAAGFAAATAHRGLRLVRMPTTVLSQSDGGLGVKNGVNAFGAKNFIGTFAVPFAVLNDAELLRTLSPRESRAGMAESVKVALLRDAQFFGWLEQEADALREGSLEPLATLVRRGGAIHLAQIREGGDPFELGSSRPLDYGHWAAHKLEVLSGHELRHGEAVAIGMLLDARYAEQQGLLPAADLQRIARLLERLGLPGYHPALELRVGGELTLMRGLDEFREHLGGALTITLLRGIGRSTEVSTIDSEQMARAIDWLAQRPRDAGVNPG